MNNNDLPPPQILSHTQKSRDMDFGERSLFYVTDLHLDVFIYLSFYTADSHSTLFTQTLLNTSRQHILYGQTQVRIAQSNQSVTSNR